MSRQFAALLPWLVLLASGGVLHAALVSPLELSADVNTFGNYFYGKVEPLPGIMRPLYERQEADMTRRELTTSRTISALEYDSLVRIHRSTGGDQWMWDPDHGTAGLPWNITNGEDPCLSHWQGVGCVCPVPGTLCVVVQLDLFGKKLVGRIPLAVAGLPYLAYLNLGSNSLSGQIPKEISYLDGLQYLFLYINYLTGEIPIEIYSMSTLLYLILGREIDFNRAAQFDDDGLVGTIPQDVRNLTSLEYLYLFDTRMTGTLPSALGDLRSLKALVIASSPVAGTIPTELKLLEQLEYLVIGNCRLTGTIPLELHLLTNLTVLSLNANLLYGTIPLEMYSLSKVQLWYTYNNALTGSIPDAVVSLSSLFIFENYNNQLTGTIPTALAQLSALSFVDISSNSLRGTIPTIFGSAMPALRYLNIALNSLSGSIPSTIGGMISLKYLNASYNLLSGPIPVNAGSLPAINFISFQGNCLTGSLPPSLSKLTSLEFLDIGSNRIQGHIPGFVCDSLKRMMSLNISFNSFTGGIPNCLDKLSETISFLDLSSNSLKGTIPSSLGNLPVLQYLNLGRAELTGTLPTQLSRMSDNLTDLRLNYNYLSGMLHEELCSLTRLSYLDVSHNELSGAIPNRCLTGMQSIQYVFLQNNHFTGELGGIVDPSMISKLQIFDVGANAFSGSIPRHLFSNAPLLRAFSAIRNCMYGQIPQEICSASGLVELSLDGIGAAETCQQRYMSLSDAYALKNKVDGVIPRCIYELPNLKLLHLSGNGIIDTLPSQVNVSVNMNDLVLSHNLMRGAIPRWIQERQWITLDLSFNKFSGTLLHSISEVVPGSSLFLNVNRISGKVPAALKTALKISILDGNLFSCALYTDDQSLPEHDDNSAVYQCADTFQQLSFVWASPFFLSLLAIVLILTVLQLKSSAVSNWVKSKLLQWRGWMWMLEKDAQLASGRTNTVYLLLNFVQDFRLTSMILTAYILLIMLPTWLVLNHYYSTYQYLYAWTASSAYLSGKVPSIVMLVVYTGLLVCVFSLYQDNLLKDNSRKTSMFVSGILIESRQMKWIQYTCLVAGVLTNCLIIAVVNMVYVYVAITYNRLYATLAALGMAGFNLFWNNVVSVRALQILREVLVPGITTVRPSLGVAKTMSAIAISGDSAIVPLSSLQKKYEQRAVVTSCILELINKVAIPCLATSAVSSTCFRGIIVQPRVIKAMYTYTVCSVRPYLSYSCSEFATVEVCNEVSRVIYQCAGSEYVERDTTYDPPFFYSYQCSASFISTYAASYVYMFIVIAFGIPCIHSILLFVQGSFDSQSCIYHVISQILPPALRPIQDDFMLGPQTHLFDKSRFVVASVSYTAILVTFGAVFPPLAVVICVAIVCKSHILLLSLGRMLQRAEDIGIMRYRDTLLEECQDVAKSVGHQIWLLIPFAALFYSFFVFDTYGDSDGYEEASICACVMAGLVPLLLFLAKRARDAYGSPARRIGTGKKTPRGRSPTKAVLFSERAKVSPGKLVMAWLDDVQEDSEDREDKASVLRSKGSAIVAPSSDKTQLVISEINDDCVVGFLDCDTVDEARPVDLIV